MGHQSLSLPLCLILILPVVSGDISSLLNLSNNVEWGSKGPLMGFARERSDPTRLQLLSELLPIVQPQCEADQKNQECSPVNQYFPNILADGIEDPENGDICEQQLGLFRRDLQERKFWALSMLDASGKIPDGIVRGHVNTLGNFDQCIGLEEKELNITGKYCMLLISNVTFVTVPILKGACVPASCSYQQIQKILDTSVNNNTGGVKWSVTEDGCSTRDGMPWRLKDKIYISIMIFLLAVIVMCSCYDAVDQFGFDRDKPGLPNISRYHSRTFLLEEKEKEEGVFSELTRSFSVFHNFEKIFTISPVSRGITCIHGLRFLSMCWVVLGHNIAFGSILEYTNMLDVLQFTGKLSVQPIFNATVAVDTFFVMSGALACFAMLTFFQKLKSAFPLKEICVLYFTRYMRLTPALAIVVGYMATINMLVADGPFWKLGTRPTENSCIDYWWSNLLYVQNYVNPEKMCLPHSWYLACDMHYFLISPFLIILIVKNKILGILCTCVLILASNIFVSVSTYVNNYPPSITLNMQYASTSKAFFENIYYISHARFGPYGIGLLLGLLLLEFKDKKWKPRKIHVVIYWLISTTTALAIIYGLYGYNHTLDGKGSRLGAAIYGGFHRTAWGICISWIIFACHLGHGGIINSILSLQIFIPLGRLTYCTYLVSLIIQYNIVVALRDSIYFDGFFNPYIISAGCLIFIMVISTGVTVTVESPWIGITRMVQGRKSPEKRQKESQGQFSGMIKGEPQMEEIGGATCEPHKKINIGDELSHM